MNVLPRRADLATMAAALTPKGNPMEKNLRESITKEAVLDVQSNQNTYAASFELENTLEPSEYEFYYRTTTGHRSPHLQIYSAKHGRSGNKLTFSFGFVLNDYPVAPTEILTLGCIFYFPKSK
jgi:hypothetical protein